MRLFRKSPPDPKRVLRGAITVGKALNKKLDNFDTEKFESFVTGVGEKRKK